MEATAIQAQHIFVAAAESIWFKISFWHPALGIHGYIITTYTAGTTCVTVPFYIEQIQKTRGDLWSITAGKL